MDGHWTNYHLASIALVAFLSILDTGLARASDRALVEAASEQIGWQAENDNDSKTIKYGQLIIRLSRYQKSTEFPQTQIRISAPGVRAAIYHAVNAWQAGATVQFAELDSKNRFPEILFSTYSGGAHCCFKTKVFTFNGTTWVQVPEELVADGADPQAEDIDGDGRAEIREPDGGFLYAFESYASSWTPTRILQLSGTKWIDVSRNPKFAGVHRKLMSAAPSCRADGSNGYWPAYVASAILIGEGKAAWKRMLKCYDRKESWGICKPHESGSFEPEPKDFGPTPPGMDCAVGHRSFPNALDYFLRSSDYGGVVTARELAQATREELLRQTAAKNRDAEAERQKVEAERQKAEAGKQKAAARKSITSTVREPVANSAINDPASLHHVGEPLWQQVASCWRPPDVGPDRVLPRVWVEIFLSSKGALLSPPVVVNSAKPDDLFAGLVAQTVLDAIAKCAPYSVTSEGLIEDGAIVLVF